MAQPLRRGDEWHPPFVGAMKIARQPHGLASTRLNGTSHPGSLSEGAGSPQGLTEGVSSDGSSVPTVYPPAIINSVIFERYVHRGTLPQLRCAQQLPQRGSRKRGAVPFIVPLGNREVAGDFHRPYGGPCDVPIRNHWAEGAAVWGGN